MSKHETTFLIIVATQLELKILLSKFSEQYTVEPIIGDMNYFNVSINGNLVYIVKCQMGSGGSGGSILTTDDAINKIDPDIVIMCGIAWGAEETKQKIGDVLVSTKVWDYDPVKVTESAEIDRGDITSASPNLIQSIEMIDVMNPTINLIFGMIASGRMLLNKKAEVDKLKDKKPEIIGGEMESAGMVATCERKNKKWIMVKGICDWGYKKDSENKEEMQCLAANNAADIIFLMLKKYNANIF